MALGGGGREVFRQREWVGAMENKRAPGGRGGEEKPDEGRGEPAIPFILYSREAKATGFHPPRSCR